MQQVEAIGLMTFFKWLIDLFRSEPSVVSTKQYEPEYNLGDVISLVGQVYMIHRDGSATVRVAIPPCAVYVSMGVIPGARPGQSVPVKMTVRALGIGGVMLESDCGKQLWATDNYLASCQ